MRGPSFNDEFGHTHTRITLVITRFRYRLQEKPHNAAATTTTTATAAAATNRARGHRLLLCDSFQKCVCAHTHDVPQYCSWAKSGSWEKETDMDATGQWGGAAPPCFCCNLKPLSSPPPPLATATMELGPSGPLFRLF